MTSLHAFMACSISFSVGVLITTTIACRIIRQRDVTAQRMVNHLAVVRDSLNGELVLARNPVNESVEAVREAFAGLDWEGVKADG